MIMDEDEFDTISRRVEGSIKSVPMTTTTATSKSRSNPSQFLGENSSLVNLDNLLPLTNPSPVFGHDQPNPFGVTTGSLLSGPQGSGQGSTVQQVNPFHLQNIILKPSINEIREKQQQETLGMSLGQGYQGSGSTPTSATQILIPTSNIQPHNNPWSPVKNENPFQ